jgi:hypothetical protein
VGLANIDPMKSQSGMTLIVLDQVKHEPTLHNALTHAEYMKDTCVDVRMRAHRHRKV